MHYNGPVFNFVPTTFFSDAYEDAYGKVGMMRKGIIRHQTMEWVIILRNLNEMLSMPFKEYFLTSEAIRTSPVIKQAGPGIMISCFIKNEIPVRIPFYRNSLSGIG